jgi:hypothetical protein
VPESHFVPFSTGDILPVDTISCTAISLAYEIPTRFPQYPHTRL